MPWEAIAVEGFTQFGVGRLKGKASMRKIATVLVSALSLAGCESNLFLPMEPTPESVDAPRRALTEAEKQTISGAVSPEIKGARPENFAWAPLVVRTHDGVTDYCGLVTTNGDAGRLDHTIYYAQIRFDSSGRIAKVDVKSIDKSKEDNIPTPAVSQCTQDGYPPPPATTSAVK